MIPFVYDWADAFSEGLAVVMREDRNGDWQSGFIDKKGNEVIPFVYDGSGAFSEGLAAVRREDRNGDGKWGFIDKKGNAVIPFVYDFFPLPDLYFFPAFSEGLAAMPVDSDYGLRIIYIDKKGNEVLSHDTDLTDLYW